MTELLERAITAVKNLPEDTQDAIAIRLLDEIEDEQRWSQSFEATTDKQWDQLVACVRRSITDEDTIPLEKIISSPAEL